MPLRGMNINERRHVVMPPYEVLSMVVCRGGRLCPPEKACHSEPVLTLAWESVPPKQEKKRIAASGFALLAMTDYLTV